MLTEKAEKAPKWLMISAGISIAGVFISWITAMVLSIGAEHAQLSSLYIRLVGAGLIFFALASGTGLAFAIIRGTFYSDFVHGELTRKQYPRLFWSLMLFAGLLVSAIAAFGDFKLINPQ